MTIHYVNMSTPASFGVEWSNGDNGSRFQLANPRGTGSLIFGVKPAGQDRWITTTVIDPSRFGMDKAPKSYAAFMTTVRKYVEE
jgi:hypothetical protein